MVIAIDLLFAKKPIIGPNPTIKKVLKRLKAIENKVSVYTEIIPLLKVGKFWV